MGQQRVDLVFKGGGIKGIALVGALAALEEHGLRPGRCIGTSAGAILTSLVAAGYSAAELRDIFLSFDFGRLRDKNGLGKVPVLGPALNLLLVQGLYQGDEMHRALSELLAAKGVHTFADLRRRHPDGSGWEDTAQVVAADLTERRLLVLPRDARLLGLEPHDLEVALTVRMSAGLPLVFAPVRLANPHTGREHLIVDGGVLSNFPIWVANALEGIDRPILGLRLTKDERPTGTHRRGLRATLGFVSSVARTMIEAHDRHRLEDLSHARIIDIPTLGVRTAEFDLPRERKLALYESGRSAAMRFLSQWDAPTHHPTHQPDRLLPIPRPPVALANWAA